MSVQYDDGFWKQCLKWVKICTHYNLQQSHPYRNTYVKIKFVE